MDQIPVVQVWHAQAPGLMRLLGIDDSADIPVQSSTNHTMNNALLLCTTTTAVSW